MAEGRPLVTVCMPTFQGERWLGEAIDSALAQTCGDFELVIVDDSSRDGTVALCQDYARRDPRVSVHVNARNLGLVGNWNACLERARGEWIKFLFQDDLLEAHCLERMLAPGSRMLDAGSEPWLVACRRSLIVADDTPEPVRRSYQAYVAEHDFQRRFPGASEVGPAEFADHLVAHPVDNCIGEPVAMLVRRLAVERFGGFHPHLLQLVDWEFAARIAVNTGMSFIDEPLCSFRLHAASMTSKSATGRQYRKEVLDPLIVLHELVHAEAFAEVRDAALRSRPHVDLKQRLRAAAGAAKSLASECPDPERRQRMLAEWDEVCRNVPALAHASVRRPWERATDRLRRGLGRLLGRHKRAL